MSVSLGTGGFAGVYYALPHSLCPRCKVRGKKLSLTFWRLHVEHWARSTLPHRPLTLWTTPICQLALIILNFVTAVPKDKGQYSNNGSCISIVIFDFINNNDANTYHDISISSNYGGGTVGTMIFC